MCKRNDGLNEGAGERVSRRTYDRANKQRKVGDRRRVSEKAIKRKRRKNTVKQLAKWKPKKKNDKNIDRIQ